MATAPKVKKSKATASKGAKAKTAPKKTAKPKAKPKSVKNSKAKKPINEPNNKKTADKKDAPMNVKSETDTSSNAKLEQSGNSADKLWRLIAMIAFAFIGNFALIAIFVLSAMQFIVVLMENKPNQEIQSLVDKLTDYLKEIFNFLSYKNDVMPFPFSSFPK